MKALGAVLVFLMGCLFAGPSDAVSRVGGGKVKSQFSEFALTIPSEYFRVEASGVDAVVARGPVFYDSRVGKIEAFLRISEFATFFADAKELTANELGQRLQKSGWVRQGRQNPCIEVFRSDSGSVLSYVATWGSGRGFVVNASKLDYSDKSIQVMLSTLEVDPGSCTWK